MKGIYMKIIIVFILLYCAYLLFTAVDYCMGNISLKKDMKKIYMQRCIDKISKIKEVDDKKIIDRYVDYALRMLEEYNKL